LAKNFTEMQLKLVTDTREQGEKVEARLISNYSLILAATKTMVDLGIPLPYVLDDFYIQCKNQVVKHNRLLKDNNSIHNFWKTLEILFDMGIIQQGRELIVSFKKEVEIKENSKTTKKIFADIKKVLLVRFSNVHSAYTKFLRERNQTGQGEETLLLYLKEQSYFIGLVPLETFNDKRTSCYAFDYNKMEEEMSIVFEKNKAE